MKKTVRRVLLIVILFLCFQFVMTCLVKEHNIDYKITVDKKQYAISENFEMIDKQHIYTLEIKDNKNKKYHFQFFINYNKQHQIVEDLALLQKDQISCVYPILKNNEPAYLICRDDKKEFSYEVLKQEYEEVAKDFMNQLKKRNIVLEEDNATAKKYEDITYYPDNFRNINLSLWNYHQLYYLTDEKAKTITLFKNDQYENQYSIVIDNYYLVIDTDQEHDFNQFYIIDLKKGTKTSWKLKQSISLDSYFLGAVAGKAYLFDRDNLVEYALDPKNKIIEVIGTVEKNGKYYNGTWHDKNVYEFKNEKLFFPKTVSIEAIEKIYPNAEIYETENAYYFIENQNLYVSYKDFKEASIQLLSNHDIKEVQIQNNHIYFINNDTIYCYTIGYSLKKLLTSREIQFNYQNIYTIYSG